MISLKQTASTVRRGTSLTPKIKAHVLFNCGGVHRLESVLQVTFNKMHQVDRRTGQAVSNSNRVSCPKPFVRKLLHTGRWSIGVVSVCATRPNSGEVPRDGHDDRRENDKVAGLRTLYRLSTRVRSIGFDDRTPTNLKMWSCASGRRYGDVAC